MLSIERIWCLFFKGDVKFHVGMKDGSSSLWLATQTYSVQTTSTLSGTSTAVISGDQLGELRPRALLFCYGCLKVLVMPSERAYENMI